MMLWEWMLTTITALGSVMGSIWAIRGLIKYEEKICDKRMEAFKEGLDRSEKTH
jgi:hypothetical protein